MITGLGEREYRTKVISTLFCAYGKADDSKRINVYVAMTEDVPADLLSKACKKLVVEQSFIPAVAEIVAAARSLASSVKREGRVLDHDEAWAEVLKNVSRFGIYQKPTWSSEAISEAVQTLGWRNLCFMQEGDRATYAHFRDVYNAIVGRKRELAMNAYVLGLAKGSIALLEVGNAQ